MQLAAGYAGSAYGGVEVELSTTFKHSKNVPERDIYAGRAASASGFHAAEISLESLLLLRVCHVSLGYGLSHAVMGSNLVPWCAPIETSGGVLTDVVHCRFARRVTFFSPTSRHILQRLHCPRVFC